MESFGVRLRQAREKLNLTVDQVSRDTHIAKRHIEGLEHEDFSGFPGETYTLGFLRNYASFLSLNADEMVTMYRNLRIQEQPVPMTELLETPGRPVNMRVVGLVALGLVVLAGLTYGVWKIATLPRERPQTATTQGTEAEGEAFVLQEPTVVRWFSQGDRIIVVFGTVETVLKVARIDRELYLELPGGVDILAVGDRKRLDLNNDGTIDLQIQLNSVDTTAGQRKANIGLYKIARAGDEPPTATGAAGELTGTTEPPASGDDIVRAPVRSFTKPVVTLREAEAAGPFAFTVSFSGRCLFRYQIDDGERETRLFLKGGVFELEVEQSLRLWVSDGGVADVRVAGKELDLGRQGEVSSVDIHWVRDPETRKQKLRAFPMY